MLFELGMRENDRRIAILGLLAGPLECGCSATCPERHSVDFGWPVAASISHTVRRASSMQYQSLPPPVTSYCHCSRETPLTTRIPSVPFSGCCRESRWRGSVVMRSHAVRVLPGAAAQTFSQPSTADLLA
jgi:hypothetical protein